MKAKDEARKTRRKAFKRVAFLLALCLLPLALQHSSSSQTETASLHRWGAVTLFHGLPSDQVHAIAQDREGVMWFGTDAGLARYDGRRVQTVSDEGLASRRVLALRDDGAGALWVGTDGGAFVRVGEGSFRAVPETKGKQVTAVLARGERRAVLATGDGLVFDCQVGEGGEASARQLGERLTVASGKTEPLALTSLAASGDTLIVGTKGRGLLTIEADGVGKEVVGRPRVFFVEALERGASGELFFGAQTTAADAGLYRVEGERFARPSKVAAAPTGTVKALASTPSGDLYAATDGRGVFRYRAGLAVEHFTFAGTAGALRSDRVGAVFVDREGVVWFGTPRGVCRYDPRGVRVEQVATEADGNFVRTLYRTSRGRLLAGTSAGLYARDRRGPVWRQVEEVGAGTVHAISEDRGGLLLVGTSAGLYVGLQAEGHAARSAPVKLAPEEKAGKEDAAVSAEKGEATKAEGQSEDGGKAAGQTPKQEGAEEGTPAEAEDEKAAVKKSAEPALKGSVRAIAALGEAVYVGTFGRGLERFDGPGRRTLVWPREGDDARGREVVSLYADESRGRVWVGTANAGAFYFDGQGVKTEAALAPLARSTVWGFGASDGWLWVATGRGLYAFKEGQKLVEVAPGLDARGVVAVKENGAGTPQAWCATAGGGVVKAALDGQFGALTARLDAEQGLPNDNAFAVLLAEEEEGARSLLVGTTRGLARYEPGGLPPSLRLTRATASRSLQPEALQRGAALRLEYPQNNLVVDVAATATRTFPEQFQYAFLLEDSAGRAIKQKLSRDSQFQIEALAPGTYRVTARAYALDLTPSDPISFEFEVARAPFPRTTVALSVLLALALVALVWAYVQHRRIVRSGEELREANSQLAAARLQLANEAESERRRIARDLHDQTLADLRRLLLLTDEMQQGAAVVTPAGAASMVETAAVDPAALRDEIESISQEVRRICEDLSPSVLENVGFAAALEWALASAIAHLPADCRFSYDFVCDEDLEERLSFTPAVQMQVYRIVQEAVSNVCRHANATRALLSVHLSDEGEFVIRLEDDGRGFETMNRREQRGRGLAGIRARAGLIEAEVEWKKGEGGGTVFVLKKEVGVKT
ncbi:MAG TPA: two-component regulator propeller domain-containing protein [Pyrinomonadaceae bacterium]|nr:two-component regulator propeller domain-containing protein [Pyrinomonadaceae bacterium]